MRIVVGAAALALLFGTMAPSATGAGTTVLRRQFTPADREAGRYQYVAFEVPPGATRLTIHQAYDRADGANVLDLGLFEPGSLEINTPAFRGWSGGARAEILLTPETATPGYRPGPLPAGTWHVALGLYRVSEAGVDVELRVTIETSPAAARRPPSAVSATAPATADASDGLRWYSGDLHVHTHHSDGVASLEAVMKLAADAGLDFVAITDHNNTTHALEAQLPTAPYRIVGEEVTTPSGHANVWGLTPGDWVDFRVSAGDPRIEEIIRTTRSKGALFSVNHPVGDCLGCDWQHAFVEGIGAIEVWNGPLGPQPGAVALWDRLLREGRRLTGVASSDWHRPPAPIGAGSVRVLARSLTTRDLLEAIAAGRVVMMRDPASPPPSLIVIAGQEHAGVGETLRVSAGAELDVRVDVPHFTSPGLPSCPADCRIELLWNGEPVATAAAGRGAVRWRRTAETDGYLRIAMTAGEHVVALTNPVFVEIVPASAVAQPFRAVSDAIARHRAERHPFK